MEWMERDIKIKFFFLWSLLFIFHINFSLFSSLPLLPRVVVFIVISIFFQMIESSFLTRPVFLFSYSYSQHCKTMTRTKNRKCKYDILYSLSSNIDWISMLPNMTFYINIFFGLFVLHCLLYRNWEMHLHEWFHFSSGMSISWVNIMKFFLHKMQGCTLKQKNF